MSGGGYVRFGNGAYTGTTTLANGAVVVSSAAALGERERSRSLKQMRFLEVQQRLLTVEVPWFWTDRLRRLRFPAISTFKDKGRTVGPAQSSAVATIRFPVS